MKKFIIILFISIIIIGLISTNPTKADFVQYANEAVQNKFAESSDSSSVLEGIFKGVAGKVVTYAIENLTVRKDYYFFSTYTIKGKDTNLQVVGVFKKFIPINGHLYGDNMQESSGAK